MTPTPTLLNIISKDPGNVRDRKNEVREGRVAEDPHDAWIM